MKLTRVEQKKLDSSRAQTRIARKRAARGGMSRSKAQQAGIDTDGRAGLVTVALPALAPLDRINGRLAAAQAREDARRRPQGRA